MGRSDLALTIVDRPRKVDQRRLQLGPVGADRCDIGLDLCALRLRGLQSILHAAKFELASTQRVRSWRLWGVSRLGLHNLSGTLRKTGGRR